MTERKFKEYYAPPAGAPIKARLRHFLRALDYWLAPYIVRIVLLAVLALALLYRLYLWLWLGRPYG